MKTYEIITEVTGKKTIIYYTDNDEVLREFYCTADGTNIQEIRQGYTLKE